MNMKSMDISDLHAFYADQRRVRASLSFAEKIARVEKMRDRDEALRVSRTVGAKAKATQAVAPSTL